MPTGNTLATFFDKADGKSYFCKEGDLTIDSGYSTLNAAKQNYIKLANPIVPENFVKFVSGEELTIQNVANGNTATHITQYEPEWATGPIPTVAATEGNYDKRSVTAFRLTTGEMQLPLSSTNTAISAGDKLEIDATTNSIDKAGSSSSSKVTALQNKTANKGGYILVDLREPSIPVATKTVSTSTVTIAATKSSSGLAGVKAKLTLKTDSTKTYTNTTVTGSTGGATISSVPYGTYEVSITTTPDGATAPTSIDDLVVDASTETLSLSFT
jgi:hypothetical protein